jgi:hypothetical protein
VRHPLEVLAPLRDTGCAAEVVERDRRVAALGEAERELLVEEIKTADVRQDRDPRSVRRVGRGRERRQAVAVTRLQHEVVVRHRRARDRSDGRQRVAVEAHRR